MNEIKVKSHKIRIMSSGGNHSDEILINVVNGNDIESAILMTMPQVELLIRSLRTAIFAKKIELGWVASSKEKI